MSVLVFAENKNGHITKSSLEAIYYGSKIAEKQETTTTVVTFGTIENNKLAALGNYGATKVFINNTVDAVDSVTLSKLVTEAQAQEEAVLLVFSHDYTGKAVAPYVAAKLNAGIISGVIDFPSDAFNLKKTVFSGKAFANCTISSDIKIISLLPNSISIVKSDAIAAVENFNCDCGTSSLQVKEFIKEGGDGILLTEAELVVSAGRGLKGPENWGMIEELATEMGAATACSRPVADIGWRPHHEHVGQTGIAIRPNLYIATGISGAIQHLAGVNGSKTIVVINTDSEAPFFKAADYGVVGDAFEVIPKLTAAYKKFKTANN